ncbi:MAG TPA: hypothetical protein VMW69_10840, partial [Spirochaetia bacterium]|nr:hypothetical protein [Spirochaetia bacterium]
MMPNDVQVLLSNISTGFRESLPEAIVTTIIFFGFVFGLVYYYVKQKRLDRERKVELYERRYAQLLKSSDLPGGSVILLDRLARYLKDSSRQYLLLESEASFNSCLKKLKEHEPVSPALLAALRLKLGFGGLNPEKTPLSSGDIAEDSAGIIERIEKGGRKERFAARIAGVEPGFLSLEVKKPEALDRGDRVTFYFFNSAGLYSLKTRVIGFREGMTLVSHSSSITAVQRRRYYRRKLVAPAYIRRVGGEDAFIKTILQDLGGGGARVINPHDIFEKGDTVELA